jgi:hypothetical protein
MRCFLIFVCPLFLFSVPNTPAPPLQASTSLAPTFAPIIVASATLATIPKDNFKPTPHDKPTQNVFDFAKQFYKTTKDKPLDRIEDALMNLESNDAELADLLHMRTATGPSAHLSGTPEEWHKYLRCCNLRSLFLKPTAYIQDVKNQILKEQIDFYNFQQEPRKWVKQLWEHLRIIRVRGHANEQFILTIDYILEQLDNCFKTWKISDCFYEVWMNDPSNVPDHVGGVHC